MLVCAFLSLLSFFITPLVQHACAGKYKERIPIHVNIAGEQPNGIMVAPSRMIDGARYYYVKRPIVSKFRMGAIMEGNEVILPGSRTDLDRFFFFAIINGNQYVRIVIKYVDNNEEVRRKVYELMRTPSQPRFTPIYRIHIELDVAANEHHPFIHYYMDEPTMTKRYCIRPEANLEAVIGTIKHGSQVLLQSNNGLMNRNVIFEVNREKNRIIVVSAYVDGLCVKSGFRDTGDVRGFMLEELINRPMFLQPRDEEIFVT